jgi:DNA anti-recombination protein RmuC
MEDFIGRLTMAAVIIGQALVIWVTLLNRKQRREVSFEFTPASREELEKLAARNQSEHDMMSARITRIESEMMRRVESLGRELREAIESVRTELADQMNKSRERTVEQLNEIVRAVGELEGMLRK